MFLAKYLDAYAADLSTFVGSFPKKLHHRGAAPP